MPLSFEVLSDSCDPLALCRSTHGALLESARLTKKTGRYSIVAFDPFLILDSRGGRTSLKEGRALRYSKKNPFEILEALLRRFARPAMTPEEPPFLGGAIGIVGYDAKGWIEPRFQDDKKQNTDFPELYFQFFNEGFVVDHACQRTWVFAENPRRLGTLLKEFARAKRVSKKSSPFIGMPPVAASLTRATFVDSVRRIKRYIKAGDIFQANFSQRFDFSFREDVKRAYARLRTLNPSAFFGILNGGDFQILSGSPERLVSLERGKIQTRPIAGTRARGKNKKEDKQVSLDLILNEKERAEHLMLVDLERNDMGRVSAYGSVGVSEFMTMEDYSHVKHIVSNVEGVLRKNLGAVDVLKAFFPGGTITGAPKIRSMEIIDELEPTARGPYTGSMGYLSFSGNMDMNILIRSLLIRKETASLQVGAGIVADSDPEKEYDETLYKAAAIFSALFGERRARRFLQSRGVAARIS